MKEFIDDLKLRARRGRLLGRRGALLAAAELLERREADFLSCTRRNSQLSRANAVLSGRAERLLHALSNAEGQLARGVAPDVVRSVLRNSME